VAEVLFHPGHREGEPSFVRLVTEVGSASAEVMSISTFGLGGRPQE
jgi:hypothetical protein